MEQVCEHLDKEHLPQIVEELRLDNIDIRVIDAQGNDWVKTMQKPAVSLPGTPGRSWQSCTSKRVPEGRLTSNR